MRRFSVWPWVAIYALGAALWNGGAAAQSVILVDPGGGGDFTTIREAVNRAAEGGIVAVKDGVYAEVVVIDKPVTIAAESPRGALVKGGFAVTADRVVIDGFSVDATDPGGPKTAFAIDGDYIEIANAGEISVGGETSLAGIRAAGGNGSVRIAAGGAVSVIASRTAGEDGALDAAGIEVDGAGTAWTLEQLGPVGVAAEAVGSRAAGVRFSAGDESDVVLSGGITVAGGRYANALVVTAGDRIAVEVAGNLFSKAHDFDGDAYGVQIRSGSESTVVISEALAAEGGWYADAMNVEVGDRSEVRVSGDVVATAKGFGAAAYGVRIDGGRESAIALAGDVTVKASRFGQGNAAGAYSLSTGDAGRVAVSGAFTVEGDFLAFGIRALSAGARSVVSVGGPVAVTAVDPDSVAFGVRALNSGEESEVGVSGAFAVEGGRRASGIEDLTAGAKSSVIVSGPITATSHDWNSEAYGIYYLAGGDGSAIAVTGAMTATGLGEDSQGHGISYLLGGNESTITVAGSLTAEGGFYASGAWEIGAGDDSVVKVGGDAGATARDQAGEAYGIWYLHGGDRSALTVTGAMSATGLGEDSQGHAVAYLYGGNDSAITVAGDLTAEADYYASGVFELRTGDRSTVIVSGDVAATARGQRSSAFGLDVIAGADSTVVVEGAVTAKGGGENRGDPFARVVGVWGLRASVGDGSAVAVLGPVAVTALEADGSAGGVRIEAGTGVTATIAGPVSVRGSYVSGVVFHAGEDCASDCKGTGPDPSGRGGALVITGDVDATGKSATGVLLGGKDVALFNAATVHVQAPEGDWSAAVVVDAWNTVEITNEGVIDAGAGNAILVAGAADTAVYNSGRIVGHLSLGDGSVRLTLSETSEVKGDIDLGRAGEKSVALYAGTVLTGALVSGGSTNTLMLLGAPGSGARSTRLNRIDGFDRAGVKGGRWAMEDEARIGAVEIENGMVHVNGVLAGTSVSLTGGVLGGSGTLAVDEVRNAGGTVAPGDSFGVLFIGAAGAGGGPAAGLGGDFGGDSGGDEDFRVGWGGSPAGSPRGDYVQEAGGVLEIEIRPSADPRPGVDYDQLRVAGKAVFEDGATIRILPQPGVYQSGVSYAIVDGAVEFDPEKVNLVFGGRGRLFLDGSLGEGSVELLLAPKPFEAAAASPNQAAVARVLTALKDAGTGGFDDLFTWLFGLEAGEEPAAREAFDSLAGEVYAALAVLAANRLENLAAAGRAFAQGGPAHDEADGVGDRPALRATAYVASGAVTGDRAQGTAGAAFRQWGATAGADVLRIEGFRAGFLGGFHEESLEMDERRSFLQGSGVHYGIYALRESEGVALSAVAAASATRAWSEREIAFGKDRLRAQGAMEATDAVFSVEARLAPLSAGGLVLTPIASLGRYATRREEFSETGAGSMGLAVQRYAAAWLRGRAGVRIAPANAGDRMSWHARAAWAGDLTEAERTISAAFAGAPGKGFDVRGAGPGRGGLELNFAASGKLGEYASWELGYDGELREGGARHALHGRLAFTF